MTDRALFFRCLERLAQDGKKIGLSDRELAVLFTQAGADCAVGIWGAVGAAAWLRHWAKRLKKAPRECRGSYYAWLDE